MQIKQCENGISLKQSKYVVELLKRFDISNAKPFSTPMSPLIKLDSNSNGKKVDMTLLKGMIRSLLYLTISIPDIMLCLCARYQVDPKESHLLVIK